MLHAEIHKRFSDFSLDAVLEAEPGEIVALLGGSGSGKTLSLRCVAGLEHPDSGRVELEGKPLFDSKKKIQVPVQKRQVGYLFQSYALFPTKTVQENLLLGVRKESRKHAQEQVRFWIRRMRLEGLENRKPLQLSGGEQQRVALARILINQPRMLLLDEAFSALDGFLKWQLLWELREDLQHFAGPVVFVSHEPEEVRRLASRVIVMDQGQSRPSVSVQTFFEMPNSLAACKLCGCRDFSPFAFVEEGGVHATAWNLSLPLQRTLREWNRNHPNERPNWLALRPGALRLTPPSEGGIPVQLSLAQQVQSAGRIALWFQAGQSRLTCEIERPLDWSIREGERMDLWIDPTQVILFHDPQKDEA